MTLDEAIGLLLGKNHGTFASSEELMGYVLHQVRNVEAFPRAHCWDWVMAAGIISGTRAALPEALETATLAYWSSHAQPKPEWVEADRCWWNGIVCRIVAAEDKSLTLVHVDGSERLRVKAGIDGVLRYETREGGEG